METEPLQEVKYNAEVIDNKLKTKNDTIVLWIIVITGSMIAVADGIIYVWPSSAIPKLLSNNTAENPIGRPVTSFEVSMMVGLPTLAMLFGSIVYGFLSNKIGRKGSIQTAGVGIFISVVSLAFSTNIICVIAFRSIWVFFCQGGYTVYLVYIIEICEDHKRGKYSCLGGALLPLGQLMGFVLGAQLNFRYFTIAGTIPLILLLVFTFLAPESPVYSLSKGRKEECIRALKKLRYNKSEKELETDLRIISDTIESTKNIQTISLPFIFNSKIKRYTVMLAIIPFILKMVSGMGVVIQFMEPIFIAAETKFNSSHMPIIVAVFKFFTFFLTPFVIEKYGRKMLLLISTVGSAITLLVLGCFFQLKVIKSPLIPHLQWLPLVCIVFYIIFFSIGVGSIPQAIVGEFFTPQMRSAGVSFAFITFSILLLCSSATYPYIVEYLGLHWCFWTYSFISLAGAVVLYKVFPENKGKSILEIQEYIKMRCAK